MLVPILCHPSRAAPDYGRVNEPESNGTTHEGDAWRSSAVRSILALEEGQGPWQSGSAKCNTRARISHRAKDQTGIAQALPANEPACMRFR